MYIRQTTKISANMSNELRNLNVRRRNILFIIHRYLTDNCFYGAAQALKNEARLSEEFELCDNVDLDAIYLEYASYYNLKFGKYPKILRKITPPVKIEIKSANGAGADGGNTKRKACKAKTSGDQAIANGHAKTVSPTVTCQFDLMASSITCEQIRTDHSTKQQQQQQQEQQHQHHYHHNQHLFNGNTQPSMKKLRDELIGDGNGPKQGLQQLMEIEQTCPIRSDDALYNSADWQILAELVNSTILRDNPKFSWHDIFGNQQAVEIIKEAVITPLQYPELFRHGLKPWSSVLLHGPPGSGKTLLAKTLYAETQKYQVTFFNISSSILVSKWRGESEKIARVLFHMAIKRTPSIIFFDEIDGFASKRDRHTDHEPSRRFKNELLQLIDGIDSQLQGVFILASTNLPWEIDDAFLRRFEKKLIMELPNEQEREKLISKLLTMNGINLLTDQLKRLVQLSQQFTGDEIRLACKEIAMQHLRHLLNHTKGSSSNSKESVRAANKELATLERAFQQIKPMSVKLMSKYERWQQENGS